ncbi:hypothetical protein [Actinokineospora globicatena]|uniref:Uncharacterized protein n=1 Tax=Actinokineospora globicatena TaxID=103729 RepID=A0A9W6QQB7_9PSEU|nr:hypothetical protein [Actinokineospora globicatena]GLW92729.1 hypothetical protein Aglo03_35450 [Actinokineospora globicatena]
MTEPITHSGFIAVAGLSEGVDLVAEVRALNDAGVEVPWLWNLAVRWADDPHSLDQEILVFGVHNDRGFLSWQCGMTAHVPVNGRNSEWSSAYLGGMH